MTRNEIEQLYIGSREKAKSYALALCQDSIDADDIVQDCFLSMLENAGNIEPKGAKQYLYRSVRNKTIDQYRRNSTKSEAQTDEIKCTETDECDYMELHKSLAELPDRQAFAIFLCYWEHMSYEQIANEMECTCQAVHRLLDKAKNKLRELMTNG